MVQRKKDAPLPEGNDSYSLIVQYTTEAGTLAHTSQ